MRYLDSQLIARVVASYSLLLPSLGNAKSLIDEKLRASIDAGMTKLLLSFGALIAISCFAMLIGSLLATKLAPGHYSIQRLIYGVVVVLGISLGMRAYIALL
jgi:hypothetical protein